MSATPKSQWGWVKAMLHSVYDQPDAEEHGVVLREQHCGVAA